MSVRTWPTWWKARRVPFRLRLDFLTLAKEKISRRPLKMLLKRLDIIWKNRKGDFLRARTSLSMRMVISLGIFIPERHQNSVILLQIGNSGVSRVLRWWVNGVFIKSSEPLPLKVQICSSFFRLFNWEFVPKLNLLIPMYNTTISSDHVKITEIVSTEIWNPSRCTSVITRTHRNSDYHRLWASTDRYCTTRAGSNYGHDIMESVGPGSQSEPVTSQRRIWC